MKSEIKRALKLIIQTFRNLYLKYLYRHQIKKKFLKKKDLLELMYEKEIKEYWSQFKIKVDTSWHRWYSSRNGIKDVRYIPEDIFYSYIEPYFNRLEFKQAYEDKSIHGLIMPELKRPITVIKNISCQYYYDSFEPLSEEVVINECLKLKEFIIKPTIDSGGGKGVRFIDICKVSDKKRLIKDTIRDFNKNFIIQELIVQHEKLKRINPESVNTIRVISFLFKGDVHILSSVLRMGVNGSRVDNQAAGGVSVGITQGGNLRSYGYDKYGEKLLNHPQGFVFSESRVPGFKKVIDAVKENHYKLGHFKIVSWDFAIDVEENPIMIEYNLGFQELNFHQLNNGVLFGDLTDQVLQEVFGKR